MKAPLEVEEGGEEKRWHLGKTESDMEEMNLMERMTQTSIVYTFQCLLLSNTGALELYQIKYLFSIP